MNGARLERVGSSDRNEAELARLRRLEANHYERAEAAVTDLREFFGLGAEQLVTRTLEVNVLDLLMAQRALAALLPDWRIVAEEGYNYRMAVLVKRLAVEIAPDSHDFVVRNGRQFWEGPGGQRMTVDIWASDDRRIEESELTFAIPAADHDWLVQLLPRMREWMDANHFLRNQAITADGKFLKLDDNATWEDVMIPPAVREAIQRNCIDLLAYRDLYKANGVPLKRGLVLHGPPGTGKTMIGRTLARRCGVTFILATSGLLEDSDDVRRVFEWGRRFAPSILFFEDFDLVASERHGASRREILGEFLAGLDGLDSNEGIIAIATTNDLNAIEPALKDRPNRFDCVLEIPALGEEQRREFLHRWKQRSAVAGGPVNDPGNSFDHPFDVERVVRRTPAFTGAQLQELCRLAVFEAVDERIQAGRIEAERLPLKDEHFEAALKKLGIRRKRSVGFNSEDE